VTARDIARLGCALLLGMTLAFPLAVMFVGGDGESAPTVARESAERRAVFSPKVLDDPYFIEQQRKNVEALEAHCRDAGESCAEAEQARRWLEEQG